MKKERLRKMLLHLNYLAICLEQELEIELGKPVDNKQEPKAERMLKWFEYAHLPEHLQSVSKPFGRLADTIVADVDPGPERTAALRKLLEAKDAAVRAKLNPGG